MTDYTKQLGLDDPSIINIFKELITDIVKKEIAKAPFNRMLSAKVISVSTGVADVQLLSDGVTISGVKNKTGQTLTVGQEVYIEFINNSSSNFYIAIAK